MSVLQDKAEIVEVINLYGVALDAHAWDLLDDIFTRMRTLNSGPRARYGSPSTRSSLHSRIFTRR